MLSHDPGCLEGECVVYREAYSERDIDPSRALGFAIEQPVSDMFNLYQSFL